MTQTTDLTLKIKTLKSTSKITISGRPLANANMFMINIGQEEGDINLNFNVNFDENLITLKTLKDGQPGNEKRLPRFTFVKGQWFEVTFTCSKEKFTIEMPDEYIETYKNFSGADEFSFIQVLKDVIMKTINID